MNRVLERIRSAGAHAWLVFVQALNWIAASLLAAVLLVHQAYPQIISNAVAKLPPLLGIPAILGFCLIVHYALRSAKKAA